MPVPAAAFRVAAFACCLVVTAAVLVTAASLGSSSSREADPGPSSPPGSPVRLAEPTTLRSCGELQALIDATDAGGRLDVSGCGFALGATLDRGITLIGGTIRVPPGAPGLTVLADDVTIDGVAIAGPQADSFSSDEIGVLAPGTANRPIQRLTIRNGSFRSLGNAGIWLEHAHDVTVADNIVEDVVYGGIMTLSAAGGRIVGNVVRRIGVRGSEANSENAYGIAITRGSGSLDAEPPSTDVVVRGNLIEDVPTWEGLDTHAGLRISFEGNTTRRVARPIVITTDADGHRSADIVVTGNRFEEPLAVPRSGIVVIIQSADRVTITSNVVIGWEADAVVHDALGTSTDVTARDNQVTP